MTFHVGQKVVCVDDTLRGHRGPFFPWPQNVFFDGVYTIRDIDKRYIPYLGCVGLRLEEHHAEIVCVRMFGPMEPAFASYHFRPIVENKTDISIFTEILDRENAKPREVERT